MKFKKVMKGLKIIIIIVKKKKENNNVFKNVETEESDILD